MRLLLLYRRRWWLFYLPLLLCTAAALWWSATQWKTLPPKNVVIAAGSAQGSYSRLAQRYAEQLERLGLQVEIVYSDNQKTALALLGRGGASLAMGNGMYAGQHNELQALAIIGQEPVWIFSENVPALGQAKNARVAAGAPDSSTREAARVLLGHAGLRPDEVTYSTLSGMAAANALIDGKVDVLFQAAGEDSQVVQLLARQNHMQILGTEQAGALAVQDRRLQPLLLPQGAIELRGDIPPRDLTLMSLQTHLLIQPGLHPALQRALLDAAVEIHEMPNFLQRHGQFPNFRGSDFALSPTARAYSLGARPWVESVFPYGTAQQAELGLYAVVPILAIAILLLVWIPKLFDWRISAALNHFYGDLKFLESEMDAVAADNPMALRRLLERLDGIERQVAALDLPDEFSERWYTLREHLSAAQERLLKLRAR